MGRSRSPRALSPEISAKRPQNLKHTSTYHLESNPFEVSFSQPPSGPSITHGLGAPSSPRQRPTSKDGANGHAMGRTESSNSDIKPKLPPIAAMASPQGASDFSWAFTGSSDLGSSLRAGPLSPAMLAGPASGHYHGVGAAGLGMGSAGVGRGGGSMHNGNGGGGIGNGGSYDPTSMRTGLTPDVTRTGLTPLIGGPASFPPPSPNTAAFIQMVTQQAGANGGHHHHGQQHQQPATITPNTFATITGAMTNGHSGTSPTSGAQHPLSISHLPDTDTQNAANGLFLLSQAHQELTKGANGGNRSHHSSDEQHSDGGSSSGKHETTVATTHSRRPNASAANKRKNTADAQTSAGAGAAAANKRSRAAAPARRTTARNASKKKIEEEPSTAGEGSDDDQHMSEDDELEAAAGYDAGKNDTSNPHIQKKPETEEEKRKNFLERNRQAALKCRQRKKAWLNQLQAKVEYLSSENERLQNTTVSMREEISRLSAVIVAHRDCGLGGVSVARSEQLIASTANIKGAGISGLAGPLSGTGGGNNSGAGDGDIDMGGVSSNAPPQAAPKNDSSSSASMTTRTRASKAAQHHHHESSPIPTPTMVTVGGGGKGGRYGY